MPRSVPEAEVLGPARYAQVVVDDAPLHLDRPLDYVIPADVVLAAGHRVEVALRGRRTKGLVVSTSLTTDVAPAQLRPLGRDLGGFAWVDDEEIDLLRWAADRYGAPLGDVIRHALPGRVIDVERRATRAGWWPPAPSAAAPRVAEPEPSEASGWPRYGAAGLRLLDASTDGAGSFLWQPLPGEVLPDRLGELALACLRGGRDVLLIVPDPASPTASGVLEIARAWAETVGEDTTSVAVDVRGGPTARVLYRDWLRCRAGTVRVVVGERGATFMPLRRLGLAIVLDEASPVHKERRSPRHHVREVVFERARRAGAVGLAVGAVPSAVVWRHLGDGRLTLVRADEAQIEATRPRVLLATGELEARARISRAGMGVLRQALDTGGYGVVLAARRGEGRALVCSRCGDVVRCTSCAAAVARTEQAGWWCATCGARSQRAPACVRCGPGALSPLAAGAQRLGEELRRSLSGTVVVLEGYAQDVPPPPAILVMTRGSVLDRPPPLGRVHAVVLPDLDGALRRPVLDAAEDALRLAFAVAGWTVSTPATAQDASTSGADTAGGVQVVVETREPDHHAMRALKAWDPALFWEEESALRAAVRLPPHTHAIRLEHHGGRGSVAGGLTARLRAALAPGDDLVGPLPLGEGSVAYLVRSVDRLATLDALRPLREESSRAGVDLRLDVDPVDLG